MVHNDIDLDTALGSAFEDLIESPFLVIVRWATQKQLWREPPIFNVNCLFCALKGDADCPKVVSAVNVPFYFVAVALWCKALEAMGLGDLCALGVSLLFVLFIVSVIAVYQILESAKLVLEMDCLDFDVIESSLLELVA